MAGIESWIAIISGALAILGVVATVTYRWTKVQVEAERTRVIAENRDLVKKVGDLEGRCGQLLDQIQVAGRAGNAALHQKAQLDESLRSLMIATGASGGSIYVPVRGPRGQVHGLAFLSLEPYSDQTAALRAKIIPLKSLAGRAFVSGNSFVMVNASNSADHFKSATALSNYRPSTTLNISLKVGDDIVGVLQLLTKAGETGFEEKDLARVNAMSKEIAEGVAGITRGPDYLRALGLGEDSQAVEGSVVFFDLSSSSLLFQELSSSFALQLLNEYFEQVCEAAFRAGATLDNYMGDGALLRFNVPRPQPEHELKAVTAAVEMSRAFAEIKDYWTALNSQFGAIYHRAGIATGPLLRANLGHSQLQNLTVIGYPITVASALCDAAERDRTVIIASHETYDAVKDMVIATPIASERLGKAARFTNGAWEITAIK